MDEQKKTVAGSVETSSGKRRFRAEEKLAMVAESEAVGSSVSVVARKYGIAPSQLYQWKKLIAHGQLEAARADERVVPESEAKALREEVRNLQRLVGKQAQKIEILETVIEIGREKKLISPAKLSKLKGML